LSQQGQENIDSIDAPWLKPQIQKLSGSIEAELIKTEIEYKFAERWLRVELYR